MKLLRQSFLPFTEIEHAGTELLEISLHDLLRNKPPRVKVPGLSADVVLGLGAPGQLEARPCDSPCPEEGVSYLSFLSLFLSIT